MNTNITIKKEDILNTIEKHPEMAEVLYDLFPSLKDEIFCTKGTVLKSKNYEKSLYSIVKTNDDKWKIINLTTNHYWSENLRVEKSEIDLKGNICITKNQIEKLFKMNKRSLDEFEILIQPGIL